MDNKIFVREIGRISSNLIVPHMNNQNKIIGSTSSLLDVSFDVAYLISASGLATMSNGTAYVRV